MPDFMLGRVNHIAIAVPDLDAAIKRYRQSFGAIITEPQILPDHGVKVAFIALGNTKIEFLEPLDAGSPIAGFLNKNPDGAMHHICYEVADIIAARDQLTASGARILGDADPKIGAHGNRVLFLHPKDFCGTLIELEEIS